MKIQAGGLNVDILPGRAAFLPKSGCLVVSDLHLGKSATFRARGLAVPEGSTQADLLRLDELIKTTNARQLVIAGDLIHSADGWNETTRTELIDWLDKIDLPTVLTEGNHDQRSLRAIQSLPITVVSEIEIDGILITHDPANLRPNQAGIAGHLHPGIRIKESMRRSLKMACFHLNKMNHLVLPAFSEFTGTQPIKPKKGDRFFVEIHQKITELPAGTF